MGQAREVLGVGPVGGHREGSPARLRYVVRPHKVGKKTGEGGQDGV